MTPDERQPAHASSRTKRTRLGIALAAMAGAVTGTLIVRERVQACTCADHQWKVQLNRTNESDESLWPARAYLEGYEQGPLLLWNLGTRDPKIDHVQAGAW